MTHGQQRLGDFDARLGTATAAERTQREAAEALVGTKTAEIKTLEQKIVEIETLSQTRLRIGTKYQKSYNEDKGKLEEARASHEQAIASKDQEIASLNQRIQGLTNELKEARKKLAEVEQKLADSTSGSARKDETVSRLQAELTRAQVGGSQAGANQAATVSGEQRGSRSRRCLLRCIAERERFAAKQTDANRDTIGGNSSTAQPSSIRQPRWPIRVDWHFGERRAEQPAGSDCDVANGEGRSAVRTRQARSCECTSQHRNIDEHQC